MVKRTIFIALDGKIQSERALQWYIENMKRSGDHVCLFHCSNFQLNIGLPGIVVNVDLVSEQVKKAAAESQAIIAKANDMLSHEDIKVYSKVASGSKPHEAILNAAKDEEADHIVMGTRDLGSVKRAFVGSVSTEVVRHAHVPVTIVKMDDH